MSTIGPVANLEVAPAAAQPALAATPGERRQSALLALGRRAIISPDVAILLQDAAQLSAETLDADCCAIAEVLTGEDGLLLRLFSSGSNQPGAAGSAPGKEHRYPLAADKSLAGHALSVSRPVLVESLGQEQRFSDAFLASERVASAIAIPLKLAERAFGSLLLGSRHANKFAAHDVLFLETISHLVTTTIARQYAEQALAQDRKFLENLLATVDALVLTVCMDGKILTLNPACARVTGFNATELQGRTLWNALCLPEELRTVQNALAKMRSGRTSLDFESYVLTRSGDRRRIAWSWTAQPESADRRASVICTGVDITEREAAQVELDRLQRAQATVDTSAVAANAAEDSDHSESTQAFGILADQPGDDRRSKPRRAYPYIQLIAPMAGGQLPPRSAFREVRCRDIAAGGFSFLAPKAPTEEFFVVALGSGKSLTYLIAQAMHSTPRMRDGRKMYLVGRNYTGRAAY